MRSGIHEIARTNRKENEPWRELPAQKQSGELHRLKSPPGGECFRRSASSVRRRTALKQRLQLFSVIGSKVVLRWFAFIRSASPAKCWVHCDVTVAISWTWRCKLLLKREVDW